MFDLKPKDLIEKFKLAIERWHPDNRFIVKVKYLDEGLYVRRYSAEWVERAIFDSWLGSFFISEHRDKKEFCDLFVTQVEALVLEGNEWLDDRLKQLVMLYPQ